MTYKECKKLQEKRAYQALSPDALAERIEQLELAVSMFPEDDYWKESLALAREVFEEEDMLTPADDDLEDAREQFNTVFYGF